MTTYSSTVSSVEGPMPEDALSKPHHVVKNGRLRKFKNIYPSWGSGANLFNMLKAVIWCAIQAKSQPATGG
jgi:hypothetical protein